MKKLKTWVTVALIVAILALIVLALMALALSDIAHGEKGVAAEWTMVKVGLFVILFLILVTFISTGLVLKYFRDSSTGREPKISK